MKKIKDMKKSFILLAGAAMLFTQACQNSESLYDVSEADSNAIEFSNYVGALTRASRAAGNSFQSGDKMQVYGFQIFNEEEPQPLFNGQEVTCGSKGTWSYSPKRYWSDNSSYDFYAIFPFSSNNSFDTDDRVFSVSEFTVQDEAADQTDIMIAQRIEGRTSHDVVVFVFNHILSYVRFYLKTASDFDTEGIDSIKVLDFDVTGLYSTGAFAQDGWNDGDAFVGAWTPDEESVYDMPAVQNVKYVIGAESPLALAEDLLLLPQDISDDANLYIKYMICYSDDTKSIFTSNVQLNTIKGAKASSSDSKETLASWAPDYRYNYIISVKPDENNAIEFSAQVEDWEDEYEAEHIIGSAE